MVAGVILGKYNRAGELKCGFEVDYDSVWETRPTNPEYIVTILGNLLDNAIDAAKENNRVLPKVLLSLTEAEDHFF